MQDASLARVALTIFAIDFLRYALAAGSVWLLVGVFFRRRLAARRILDATTQPGQVQREFAYSMSTVLIFAANGVLIWLLARSGTLRIDADVATRGWAWWWLSLLLIIVTHDAWFYWTHRWLHHRRWFRTVHGRHHASLHPTPWAAYAFHPVEALVQTAFLPLFLLVVPVHGAVIGVFLVHMILRNVIGHCAHELLPWRWTPRGWLGWITPVSHHHFHHARNRGNFGLYFNWWDRWCGTEDPEYLRHGDERFSGGACPAPERVARGREPLIRSIVAASVLGTFAVHPTPAQSAEESPFGRWATKGFGSIVELHACAEAADRLCGRIVWLWDAAGDDGEPRTDKSNPQPELRTRRLVGVQIISQFRQVSPGLWAQGALYNPDDGRSYSGSIRLLPKGSLQLEGCALRVFCQSQIWHRPEALLAQAMGAAR